MKFVYAITSNGKDAYVAMTRVSVASLRLSNGASQIVLACDRSTARQLHDVNSPLLKEVDELLVCDTPQGDDCYRNRFVKTSLRQRIEGAFLYLDSDTLIRSDISDLFLLEEDIAGARNHSREVRSEQVFVEDAESLHKMGWKAREAYYINGGVIYYNDTAPSRKFGEQWHHFWLESSATLGRYRDQPALNAAIEATGVSVKLLGDEYNAQIKATASVANKAKIVHYYSSVGSPAVYAFDVLVGQLISGERLSRRQVRELARRKHPWRRDWWIDDLFYNTIAQKPQLDDTDRMWLEGRRREAFQIRWQEQRKTSNRYQAAMRLLGVALINSRNRQRFGLLNHL